MLKFFWDLYIYWEIFASEISTWVTTFYVGVKFVVIPDITTKQRAGEYRNPVNVTHVSA